MRDNCQNAVWYQQGIITIPTPEMGAMIVKRMGPWLCAK
jgi:hypothetical protein